MLYKEEYEKWCNDTFFDKETREELLKIKDDEKEIEDRFYKELEFGTAGLRGIMGAGSNRMNEYTVGKATQGLANFIKSKNAQDKGVVISYDSRNNSREFSEIAALVLNANGIKTYVFENIAPVPELSYSVRKLKTIAGIMITASHNPPKYNGYKVYGEDGAQITYPVDKEIMEEVKKVKDYKEIQKISKEEAIEKNLYFKVVSYDNNNPFVIVLNYTMDHFIEVCYKVYFVGDQVVVKNIGDNIIKYDKIWAEIK